jgi:hypothetical protein
MEGDRIGRLKCTLHGTGAEASAEVQKADRIIVVTERLHNGGYHLHPTYGVGTTFNLARTLYSKLQTAIARASFDLKMYVGYNETTRFEPSLLGHILR